MVINKIDLAEIIKADLGIMERDSRRMRGEGPFIFARATDGFNLGAIIDHIHMAKVQALAAVRADRR